MVKLIYWATATLIKVLLTVFVIELVTCAERCSNCLYGVGYCDPASSVCTFGCKPGWRNPTCDQPCTVSDCKECTISPSTIEQCVRCEGGVYGDLCNLPCSDNCNGKRGADNCDHFGNCLYGCKVPYKGAKCKEQDCPFENCNRCDVGTQGNTYCWQCLTGYYWQELRQMCVKCSDHCKNGPRECDSFTGICTECEPGWLGSRCDNFCNIQNCSLCALNKEKVYCKSCMKGMYPGDNGALCKSCVDRNCEGVCNSMTGECVEGCKHGWFGEGYLCNRPCDLANCEQCALNYHRNALCIECQDDYYVHNGLCLKCPSTCNQSCETHSSHCVGGCKVGYYGDMCEKKCNPHCLNSTCTVTTGFCDCEDGWFGYRCDRTCPIHCNDCQNYKDGICTSCESGWYGPDCNLRCNSYCQPRDYGGYVYCNKETGACENGCINGGYGENCDKLCNSNCESQVCDRDTGYCLAGCTQNFYGLLCQKNCPRDCKRVFQGYKRTCDVTTGECLDGCNAKMYGKFCNQPCNERCKDGICEQYSGACSHGCKAGYAGVDCDIICGNSCPNDCSPNCKDERCDKTTKSCVAGCNTGWYGTTCTEICSDKCVGRICRQLDGFCLGTCIDGFHGPSCNLFCNANCLEKACNKDTGFCSKGCKTSYYGNMCSEKCSSLCQNSTCNYVTGKCFSCGVGKRGDMCDESCEPGTYGENCAQLCGHCRDNVPCNMYTGDCLPGSGCEIGFTGIQCKQVLHSQEESPRKTVNMDIVIGSCVAGVGCLVVLAITILCWMKARKSKNKNKSEEPVVVYRDANVSIERTGTSHSESIDSSHSDMMLLGDTGSQLMINLQQEIGKYDTYTLHKGEINSAGRKQSCCVKLVKLADVEDDKASLNRLLKESEIQTLCGSHINVVNVITSYQNTDVYCVALDNSMETGLPQYLQKLQSNSKTLEPDNICKLLQFAIDICSALCHIHKMKIIHRQVQAQHVYISASSLAKLGDFYWACHASDTENMVDLPDESYSWLCPEALLHHKFSYQSDIWSVGVTLWEIFSLGKLPFNGVERAEYEELILEGRRLAKPSIAHLTQYRVMKSCWRYSPEDRPTADQVLQQLIDIQGRLSDVERVLVHV